MSLVEGQRMRRLDDGMEGVVQRSSSDGALRIAYQDRGEWFTAGRREKWVEADVRRLPMREEEIERVARVADVFLRAMDLHEPWSPWKAIDATQTHDPGLVEAITNYLRARTG